MALEEQMAPKEQAQQPNNLEQMTDEEEQDLQLAVLLTERMLRDDGFSVIEQALETSNDPAQVIGQFLLQMIKQIDETMPNDAKLSKRIWLAKGGWLEQIMDLIIDEFQLDYAIADKAEVYVAETATQMAKAGKAGGTPAPQPGTAPPALPQGVPQ